jgi:hypothetical protein
MDKGTEIKHTHIKSQYDSEEQFKYKIEQYTTIIIIIIIIIIQFNSIQLFIIYVPSQQPQGQL